ncbi:hypothetical protein EHN06_20990 (plasmid) [Marinobacter sp. NP-4(2019)]|uniref:hypothetical protein n=1 Tax=Marinobacter sp. NP-4(2019) TaxID=2488665 RepID=UPI000FC3ED89|nr:hypothetical protein [Marinobacter sp. NP-4(2019)]AZT86094.1 hypothetical protein EHN06_20990 [Marinobacter sp. NP-4(2019)]
MKTTYELMKEARKRKAERLQKIDGVYTLTKRTERKKKCSGSMIPDTNVGGNIATINEVSDDQKATFFFS